jgi:hypothetical protein
MKPAQTRKTKRATRRDPFGELVEGMTALAEAREGKRTLRTHYLAFKPPPELSANDLIRVRKRAARVLPALNARARHGVVGAKPCLRFPRVTPLRRAG